MGLVNLDDLPTGLTPRAQPLVEEAPGPRASEVWGAAFGLENDVVNFFRYMSQEEFEPDADPDAWIAETDFFNTNYGLNYSDNFVGVQSRSEYEAVRLRIDREEQQRRTLASGGAFGVLAAMGAGVASPTSLIPIAGWAGATARAGASVGKVVAAGAGAAAAGSVLATGLQEIVLQGAQETRTITETVFNIAGSAVIGAVLGGAASGLTGVRVRGLSQRLNAIPATRAEQEAAFTELTGGGAASAGAAATDAARGSGELAGMMGAERVFGQQDPLIRTQTSELQATRSAVRDLAETPLSLAENSQGIATSVGGSVETQAKLANAPLWQALSDIDAQFQDYFFGGRARMAPLRSEIASLTGTANGKLTFREFKEAVFDSLISGDVHAIPQVASAAAALRRRVFDPLKADAIELRLLPENVTPLGDTGYAPRMYNNEAIRANRGRFVDILTRNFLAQQDELDRIASRVEARGGRVDGKTIERLDLSEAEIRSIAEETTDLILGHAPSRVLTPPDIVAGPRGPLKERVLNIPTALIRDFVERDVEVLARAYTRTMAGDIALVRKFGATDMAETIRKINDEANAAIAKAEKEIADLEAANEKVPAAIRKAPQRIEAQRTRDIRDISAMRDRIRGTYALPNNPDGLAVRTGRVLRNLNYLRLLGGMTLSAVPDLAKAVFTHGMTRTLRTLFSPLTGGLSTFKLAAREVKLAGTALDMVLDSRVMAMADIMDDFGRGSKFERGLSSASRRFGIVSLMAPWNAALKQFAGVVTQTRMLEGIERLATGKASKKEMKYLAAGGIDRNMAERIWRQFDGSAPSSPRSFEQRQGDLGAAPVFYSAVVRAVEDSKLTKASSDQWLATIRNTPGLKAEELDWMGLPEWLKAQKGLVSKADVSAFVRANQVEVEEVVKGGRPAVSSPMEWMEQADGSLVDTTGIFVLREGRNGWSLTNTRRGTTLDFGSREAAEDSLRFNERFEGGDTKFGKWQLPGGENYRELLLTLPERGAFDPAKVSFERTRRSATQGNVEIFYDGKSLGKFEDQIKLQPGGGYTGWTDDEIVNIVRRRYAGDPSLRVKPLDDGANFRGGHWDEANVLAHIRFSERAIGDRKALHIEEIQSDWHQQGRKRGYKNPEELERLRLEAVSEFERSIPADMRQFLPQWMVEDGRIRIDSGDLKQSDIDHWREQGILDDAALATIQRYYVADVQAHSSVAVPDAPLKTTWPELAFKRMIRWAAENDFDEIVWTPGKVQADRYDLSKDISRVTYTEAGRVKYLKAFDHSGRSVIQKPIVNPADELPDIIGKDLADKLLAVEPVKVKLLPEVRPEDLKVNETDVDRMFVTPDGRVTRIGRGAFAELEDAKASAASYFNDIAVNVNRKRMEEGESIQELSGLDLKVGGEGMVGFYDKIMVATANKLGKKFGAKVKTSESEGASAIDVGDFKVMRNPRDEETPFELSERDSTHVIQSFRTSEEAWAEAERRGAQTLHSLPVTKEMREAALRGQALFQQKGTGDLQGRITFEDGGTFIELFKARDQSTFMHEAGHLWLDEMARDALVSPALKADFDTVIKWLGVPDAKSIGRTQHEKWARAWERYLADGKAPTKALAVAFERFKNWLTAIYRNVRGVAGDIPSDVRGVMDRLLASDVSEGAATAAERAIFADAQLKLIAAGMDTTEADINASVVAARYSARASRLGDGRTAQQLYDDARISVRSVGDAPAAPAPRSVKLGKVRKPVSLLRFLAANGGIKEDRGELAALGIGKLFVPGSGRLVRKNGKQLDYAREAAAEAGYLNHIYGTSDRAMAESTVADLLNAIDTEFRGDKIFSGDDTAQLQDFEAQGAHAETQQRLEDANAAIDELAGDSLPPEIRGRAAEHLLNGSDPDEALERAIMEDYRSNDGPEPVRNSAGDEVRFDADEIDNRGTAGKRDAVSEEGPQGRAGGEGNASSGSGAVRGTGSDQVEAGSGLGGHGTRDGNVWWANTEAWTDRQAVQSYRAMLVRDVDRIIVTPGQDKPLWMSTELGKLIGQFKSFMVASVQRTLLSGLQQRDMAALNGTLMMLGLGAVAYWMKEGVRGAQTSDDPVKWATEALDYSGLTGWLMEANNMAESMSGGRVGLSAITGQRASRYASRNALGAALGPSFDILGDLGQVSRALASGEWTESDVHTFRKLLPLQNLFYIRQLLDAAESGVSGALGLTASDQGSRSVLQ